MNARLKGFAADSSLLVVAVIWGVTFLMMQEATRETPVFAFLFWRFGTAFVLFALVGKLLGKKVQRESIKAGIILGVMFCLAFQFQTFSLGHTLSSVVGFITGLNVIFVPFFAWILLGVTQSLFAVLGAMIAAIGMWLLSTGGAELHTVGFGEILALINAALFALHIVYTGLYSRKHDVFTLVIVQFATAMVLCLLMSLGNDPYTIPPEFTETFIKAILVTAIFATVFAFGIQTYMQQFTTPAKTAIIFTIEPVSAGLFGYCYANESLGAMQILGGVLIVIAILCVELGGIFWRKKKEAHPLEPTQKTVQ